MQQTESLPTWSDLFGSPNTKEADGGRSVMAPAAYLADLLQLIGDRFDPSDLRGRRPDITAQILLNGEQSFSLVRQLDIANRVLGRRIASLAKKQADDALAEAQHPFTLPFEYQHERIRQLLLLLRTPYRDLYTSFAQHVDADVLARVGLGLSPARAGVVVNDLSGDAAGLGAAYGLAPDETLASLAPLERFRRATRLDGPGLRELLFSRLSQSSSGVSERQAAGQLFINHNLGGFVTMDSGEANLIWSGESKAIPGAWFDRVHRLLCLSRWTGIDLTSLDLLLRQLCQNTLDANALRRLAVLVDLRERTGATIEALCCLFGELDGSAALGAGDDPKSPASLFDHVFNGEAARLAKRYVPSGSAYLPLAYAGWQALPTTGDWLSDEGDNKELRARIQASLGLAAADLSTVVTRFRDRAKARGRVSRLASADSRGLSALHRLARLAEFVDLPPLELLRLVDLLEKDPSLKILNAFDVLLHEDVAHADLYEVLEEGPVDARSWLIQNIIAIGAWANAAGLTPEDLEATASVPGETAPKQRAELLATAQALHEAFIPSALSAESFESAEISARAARVALAIAGEPTRRLVSPLDKRLVTWDESRAREAAHAAVQALDVVRVEDLEALGLGEEIAAYLQSLLIRLGVLDVNGVLREEQFPARAEELVLEPDGSARFKQIFDLLHGLYATALAEATDAADQGDAEEGEAAEAEEGADVELQLYHSDLLKLGFGVSEADEWIERLTVLRVLDTSGMVQNPAFFEDPESRADLQISLGLDSIRTELHAQLAARRDRWRSAQLKLTEDIWDGLPLTVAERQALEQNLMFNGHIDSARRIADRKVLQALTPDTFDLALPFYRHRRPILAALQGLVTASRDNHLRVGPEELRPLADRFVAINAHRALSAAHLDGRGRLGPELLAEIDSEQPPIDLGPTYSNAQQELIWGLLREIDAEASRFRLTNSALASIDIVDEHATEVVATLCATDCLRPDRSLSADQVARFVVVNSVQNFSIPSYADYARDVFFLIHDVANAVDAAVTALMASLAAVAKAQERGVLEAIGSQIELSAEATSAIVRPLLRDEPHLAVALMAPVLRAVGPQDLVEEAPRDRTFCAAIGRTRAFANFARKLGMSAQEIEVAFRDQQLVDKFPEALELPTGVDGIDALWTGPNGQVHLFRGPQYWTFDANTLARTTTSTLPAGGAIIEQARPLSALCVEFKDLTGVDAVYTLPNGDHWLHAQGRSFRRAAGSERWVETPRAWGRVQSRFDGPASIECALRDHEGRVHLFSGDQYVRYSNWPHEFVDEGYPRRIAARWEEEIDFRPLPAGWGEGLDAAVGRKDEVTWLFKGDRYIASTAPGVEGAIVDSWGRVRNNLASASRVDAVLDIEGCCGVVMGDQVSVFSNSLESEGLTADEGYPRSLAAVLQGLPEPFPHGIDAGLTDEDGTLHLFRDQQCATRKDGQWELLPTRGRWGQVRNTLQETGCVDAALAGLDGKIYLFSGDQYVRYSGADLSRIDEGYPRTISRDWGGLARVDAAFVLDGKTYLFGSGPFANSYVRYSTRDYTSPDEGYPKETDDNWWNLPVALVERRFNLPDAVFVAPDGRIHLFSGDQTVTFDHNHRWWSEPAPVREAWSSLPFTVVSAGFTGRDGRSYLFAAGENQGETVYFAAEGGPGFVRYTDPNFQRVDDRFPKPVKEHWGKLASTLERTGRVDAAVTLVSTVTETAKDGTPSTRKQRYRYLFSGAQFYRYSSDQQWFVDEGYPLRIQNNLRREPHFVHFDAPAERGVDGVWADTGNVFVFISDRMYAASVAPLRQLDGLGVDEARAADVEEGRLTVCGGGGWRHVRPPEALARSAEPAMPRVLRTVPAQFQGKLSAILRALDKNVYLFSGEQCYDRSLERQYPTGAAWGRVRNLIAEDDRVDSALMGRDGNLYLFRGDQFVRYTLTPGAPVKVPALVDAPPLPVATHWGGLTNVRHAFVRQGVTYLLEAPAEDGTFRYVRYFGTDYSRPNEPAPLAGDFSFWRVPVDYIARGFDRVDAALTEGDDLILIRDGQFLHYEAATDTWTRPRPLSLRWPDLPRRHPDFETIRAVVRVPDDQTYFFSDGTWLAHNGERPSALTPIASRWSLIRNRITQANRVDATLVHGDQTFLFSGDEYVRYTGSRYQHVDTGYPRPIAGFLRQEAPFQQLPAEVEAAFERLKPEDVWLESAFSTGGVVCVRVAGRSYALSAQLSRSYAIQQVTRVRNELLRRARVDAAFARPDGALLLLSGDQYVRYSGLDLAVVDDGYPRGIGESLLRELWPEPPALPLAFHHDLDAALLETNGALVLFKGRHFVRCEPGARGGVLAPMEIKGGWGRVNNPFLPSPGNERPLIDAAFVAPDRALYVFQGSQYLRYTDPGAEFVDEGYPRAIRDRWGDLPAEFEAGVDAGFVFGGRTYLGRQQRYVRFSDPGYRLMDPTYPQLFTSRWRASNDFLLRDLRTIQRYVALDKRHHSDGGSLTDFLLAGSRDKVDPYALLATLFDWQVGDVQWLKRRDAFLDRPSREVAAEVRFDIEQALRIHSTLELARRLGSHPQELYEQVWTRLQVHPVQPAMAADALHRLLGALYPGKDWEQIERQLGDALSRIRRDALVAWLLAHSPEKFADARDLSDFVLTDVEVDASVEASPITEAIAAIQLYFHRYLTHLEPAAAAGDDVTRRAKFKEQWRWLKNYRVWEANRKVFLYPESYIRPELRDTRTAAFKALQDNLHQGEITESSVTQAYKKYLDEYTEVSRLIIAGGYVQPDPRDLNDTELTLFGVTRTEPQRYYYRTATFSEDSSSTALWRPWRALGIEIRSNRVYPVRAFGRTFVFWTEVEQIRREAKKSMTLRTKTTGDIQEVSGEEPVEYRLKILYSFYDLSEQWTSPQTLGFGPTESSIDDPRLRVTCTQGDGGEESIAVNFQYDLNAARRALAQKLATLAAGQRADVRALLVFHLRLIELTMGPATRIGAKRLTADLTVSSAEAVSVHDRRHEMLKALFDPSEGNNLGLDSVVVLGSAGRRVGAAWYSFDLKGGSFLARPVAATPNEPVGGLLPLLDNAVGLPHWDRVDACLDTSDQHQYLFDNRRLVYCAMGDRTEHRIDERWGLRYTKVHADGQVDAAWKRNGVLFLSRGDRYLKYSDGVEWADNEGDRGAANQRKADGVPNWPSIEAAFTDKGNTTWFFQGARFVALDATNTFSKEAEIKGRWGHERNEFAAAAGGSAVVAAFTRDGRSFLIGPATYTWYADAELMLCNRPAPQSLRALLVELKCANSAEVEEGAIIVGAVDAGTELLFKVNRGEENEVYSLKGDKATKVKRPPKGGPSHSIAAFTQGDKSFTLNPSKAGVVLTVSGSEDQRESSRDIRAAMVAIDGCLYLFGVDSYVRVTPDEFSLAGIGNAIEQWPSRSAPISGRWGRVRNVFTERGTVNAALVRGEHTILVSGDAYVRYSGWEYRFVDEGYPKALAGNPDGLPQVPFNAAVEVDGRVCYFVKKQHVFSDNLARSLPNPSRWGRIRSNILLRGVDSAYRVDRKHYLFSGNEIACYTAGGDGQLPAYMDGAPVRAELGSFRTVRGAFSYQGSFYLVGRDRFVCCAVDKPEQPLAGYPRGGQARALVADLRNRFKLPAGSDTLAEGLEVFALSLQGSALLLDTDDYTPGERVLRFDLSTGQLSREWGPSQVDWAALRGEGTAFVDLADARYSFRADQVVKTGRGIAAPWENNPEVRSVAAVWGGRPFDAAVNFGEHIHFFVDDRYCTLHKQAAKDDAGGGVAVKNLQEAITRSIPIRGGLGNLPMELMDGIDAALETAGFQFFFKGSSFARVPVGAVRDEVASVKYELVRLTTSTAAQLNRALFVGGVRRLLSLRTQTVDETPGFSVAASTPTTIRVNPGLVNADALPLDGHLDFGSANGIYLWEIFFHAPMLIAETLSTAQRFEEAKTWYEHIFDPTEPADAWKFLPFLTMDVERIVFQIRDRLGQLDNRGVNTAGLRAVLQGGPDPGANAPDLLGMLFAMDAAFQGERGLGTTELDLLEKIKQLPHARQQLDALNLRRDPELETLAGDLRELVGLIEGMRGRWDSMQTSRAQIETYLDDPFDPHAIAALRPIAYRKAIVMRYLDNLLDWGDMLFSQYTRESIGEARMLYVHAWDLLGRRPESLGRRMLPADCAYASLRDRDARPGDYDLLLHLEASRAAELSFAASLPSAPNDSPAQPYFFIPPNEELEQYWTRVADRLYKIRHGLNILGVHQPLALFEPPIDPMALVRAVAGAGGLAGLIEGAAAVDVPHYRFSFLLMKAQGLAQKVAQLGSELLAALEKRDAEALSQLHTRQEGIILALTRDLRKSQVEEAKANLRSLEMAKEHAQKRKQVYTAWVNAGYTELETAQIGLMSAAVALYGVSAGINLAAAISAGFPKALIGLFIAGVESPKPDEVLGKGAEAIQTIAEAVQILGEILGITAQHEQSIQDWGLQRDLATIDLKQIDAQINGAEWQIRAAEQEIVLAERHIEHSEAVSRFYRNKFTNQELYEWMAGRLSAIHYQTYQLAVTMARAAERSFQFERGSSQANTGFIQGQQWDSQRKGLLAGTMLGLDLDRLEAAGIATDARRFEIIKNISLVALDPMAFIKLKNEGACEFDLGEALFDYDFPGQYCRQVKTIAMDLNFGEGVLVNATLTQLTNRVVMEPDPKAVAFLLEPKETPPASIRHNWKAMQQIALSHQGENEPNNGLFELRFDNERYLPFEGTGAVSRWRLELGGRPGDYDLRQLASVTINFKYTALQGGDAFAAAVRGLLKPTDTFHAFNLSVDYSEEWQAFLEGDSDVLELPLRTEQFPNMASGRIRAIFTRYETDVPGAASFIIDMGQQAPLPDGKTVDTSGLTVRAAGTTLRLKLKGDRSVLRNVYLVMGYKGGLG